MTKQANYPVALLAIHQGEVISNFLHRELMMEFAVAMGQIPRGRPRAADMTAADTAHRRGFVLVN